MHSCFQPGLQARKAIGPGRAAGRKTPGRKSRGSGWGLRVLKVAGCAQHGRDIVAPGLGRVGRSALSALTCRDRLAAEDKG